MTLSTMTEGGPAEAGRHGACHPSLPVTSEDCRGLQCCAFAEPSHCSVQVGREAQCDSPALGTTAQAGLKLRDLGADAAHGFSPFWVLFTSSGSQTSQR